MDKKYNVEKLTKIRARLKGGGHENNEILIKLINKEIRQLEGTSLKKRFSSLYYLLNEIKKQKSRLEELETLATKCTSSISGMPGSGDSSDKLAIISGDIAELRNQIEESIHKAEQERVWLMKIINNVDDPRIREILRLRFYDCKPWLQVAFGVGERDERYVRRLVSNFFKGFSQ